MLNHKKHQTPCVATKAFIVNDGKLLINKPNDSKYWAVPGGHIEMGETPEQALKRELLEEIGTNNVTIGNPLVVWQKIVAEQPGHEIILIGFEVHLNQKNYKVKPGHEDNDFHWMTFDEIEQYFPKENKMYRGAVEKFIQIYRK